MRDNFAAWILSLPDQGRREVLEWAAESLVWTRNRTKADEAVSRVFPSRVARELVRLSLHEANSEGLLWTPILDLLDRWGYLPEATFRVPGARGGRTRTRAVGSWIWEKPPAEAVRHTVALLQRSDSDRLRADVLSAMPRVFSKVMTRVLAQWAVTVRAERPRHGLASTESNRRAVAHGFLSMLALLEHSALTAEQEKTIVASLWTGRNVRSFPLAPVAFLLRPDGTYPLPAYRALLRRRLPEAFDIWSREIPKDWTLRGGRAVRRR